VTFLENLLAIHIVTGISGSNPERVPCREILFVVNDLKRKTVILRNLRLVETFITCLVGRSFATECFCMKHETMLSLRT
jgi:hypothetical protein